MRGSNTNKTVRSVCVVGAGTRFLSGMTYYTFSLCNALSDHYDVSAILMRQLLPTVLYPGRKRVGAPITTTKLAPSIPYFDGIDWYWVPTLVRAFRFMVRRRPDVLVFQWWTGTILHSYVALALIARLLGTKIVIEFHEVLDTGEARLQPVNAYAGVVGRLLVRLTDGFVIHTVTDYPELDRQYRLGNRPVALIPRGPLDEYKRDEGIRMKRGAPESCCNLLFFGVIRPYKGLEYLIQAFDSIPPDEIDRYWLTVVGETWEVWEDTTLPGELIARSRYRDRITFVNDYVSDADIAAYLAGADAVVLPYVRSSVSGPLHTAMSHGLPVVVTNVGGLPEAVAGYDGAILVPPRDIGALCEALGQVGRLRGKHFADPHSWDRTVARFGALFDALEGHPEALKEAGALVSHK